MKKFFEEFKKFITRGNIVDMAVGVTVGSAFTAIVNGLTNNVLKPIINWFLATILKADSLSQVYWMLKPAYVTDEVTGEKVIDLAQSIYVDWGAFINAIINFLIIAFVLFCIVKAFNKIKEAQDKFEDAMTDGKPTKAQRKQMRKEGVDVLDKNAVKSWMDRKAKEEAEAKAKEEAEAAEQARLDRLANPTTEDLLKQILEQLQKNA